MSHQPLVSLASRAVRLTGIAALLSASVACTDGGGSSPASDDGAALPNTSSPSGTPGTPSSPSRGEAVNGPLTGRLLTVGDVPHRNALLSLDLRTGRHAPIDGADTPTVIEAVSGEDAARTFAADHSEPGRFIETLYNCSAQEGVRCINLWSAGAVLESVFAVADPQTTLPGTSVAKRSRDGRFVAFTNRRTEFLEIRTVAGELVSSAEYGFQLGSPYDWLPDGSLLIEQDTDGDVFDGPVRFARTEPYSASPASSLTLPERYVGGVQDIVVDPSGSRVAMLVKLAGDDSNNRRPIVLDIDTGSIDEPLAPGDETDNLDARGIHWSPDGQWLIFQNPSYRPLLTTVPVAPAAGQGLRGNVTYAIRADGGRYPLPTSVEASNDDARIVVARPRTDPDGTPSAGDATPGFVWVP